MIRRTALLACILTLLSCGPNGSLVIHDIPLDLAFKSNQCTKVEKACKQASAMETKMETYPDTSSDDYFELRQAYEVQLEKCLDLYEACESHEY